MVMACETVCNGHHNSEWSRVVDNEVDDEVAEEVDEEVVEEVDEEVDGLAATREQPCRTIVTQTWYFQGQGSGWHNVHILGGQINGRHVSQDLYNQ